jgi:hypothetical protein
MSSHYDWPRPPRGTDQQAERAAHGARLRPAADPQTQSRVGTLPRPAASRRRGRAQPKNAPVPGNPQPWIPVGPSVMVNGQATGDPNVAGRIRDIQVDPTGTRVYAASASGGVWFSPNRGQSWRPLDDWQESPDRRDVATVANALACSTIYVDWGPDAAHDKVWVGTGEITSSWLGTPGLGPGDQGTPGGHNRGIGILHAVGPGADGGAAGAWTVEKGDPFSTDHHTLRGATVFRIVPDPDDHSRLVAATDRGVYVGTVAAGGASATWARVAPIAALNGLTPIDVAVTRASGKTRVWLAAYSTLAVAEMTPPISTALTFAAVTLPEAYVTTPAATANNEPPRTRVAFAATKDGHTLYILGRRGVRANEDRTAPAAHLWTVTANAATLPTTATQVNGLPRDLFASTNDQSSYDMAIEAHPSQAGRIVVCGAVHSSGDGAVYRCEVSGSTLNATHVGTGVHADDHIARFAAAPGGGQAVWVGCDGGVFRSDAEGDDGTFVPVNDGLAVLEPGYVASHPTNPGLLLAGFQDNGTALRLGDTLWRQSFRGDGGGVIFHPTEGARYLRQYVKGTWESSSGSFTRPVSRRNAYSHASDPYQTSEKIENDCCEFYSGADAISHGGDTHLAFGSDRVWYSRDWGASWVTIPTGTDPRGGDNPDLAQDVLTAKAGPRMYGDRTASIDCCSSTPTPHAAASGEKIIAVKFARVQDVGTDKVLRVLALNGKSLTWLEGRRVAGTTTPFTWRMLSDLPPPPTPPAPGAPPAPPPTASGVFRPPRDAAETTELRAGHPLEFLPADDIVSDVAVHDPNAGSLGSCYVTTIGRWNFHDAASNDAYVDTLWFFDGRRHWYPTGLRTNNPATGNWGAEIQVTAPALGVVVDPEHPEIVYVATSVGVVKGTLTIGGVDPNFTYAWQWQQLMNGLPEASVQDLSIHWYPRPDAFGAEFHGTDPPVKVLRAALQARGVWELDLINPTPAPLTWLRVLPTDTRRRLPTPLTGPTVRGEDHPRWDASPDIVVDVSETVYPAPPSEAVLWKMTAPAGTSTPASVVNIATPRVHVLVHQRSPVAIPASDVRVALLRHDLPDDGVVPLAGLWANLVTAVTGSAAANPPTTLPAGWRAAGSTLWQRPANLTEPIEPRSPRAVTFAIDVGADVAETPFVLLAVVASAGNQITVAEAGGATDVQALVLASPHAAARTVGVDFS